MKFKYNHQPVLGWIHCSEILDGYVYYSDQYRHCSGQLRDSLDKFRRVWHNEQHMYEVARPSAAFQNPPQGGYPYPMVGDTCYTYIHVIKVERL